MTLDSQHARPPFRRPGVRVAVAIAVLILASLTGRPAHARDVTPDEVSQLQELAGDPSRSKELITFIRRMLASDIAPAYVGTLRQMMLQAMVRSNAPAKEIVAAVDTLDAQFENDARSRMIVLSQAAGVLIDRHEELDKALEFATRAHEATPPGSEYDIARAQTAAVLGRAQLEHGDVDAAITTLNVALAAPESSMVLYHLGRAYEKKGKPAQAIDTYVRSVSVFPGQDSTALVPLRTLYKKQHGSLAGLDQRVTTAKKASRAQVALDGHRYTQPAPPWKLTNFEEKEVGLADFSGKILVIDFWGSWCGPCRAELPILQKTFERYKDRVAFMAINWERGVSRSDHLKNAKDFIDDNNFGFPVALDYDYAASKAFGVEAFPTLFVIDRTGKIQYRNVGYDPKIEMILAAQIEAMLEAK